MSHHETTRRQFLRGAGLASGTLAGLGLNLEPAAAAVPKLKIRGAREVPSVRARALVSRRLRPFQIDGRTVYQVGLPWHWGYKGVVTGDVVNDLSVMVGDPNTTIHEAKVFVCRVARAEPPGGAARRR